MYILFQALTSIFLVLFLLVGFKTQYLPKLVSKAQDSTKALLDYESYIKSNLDLSLNNKYYAVGDEIIIDYKGDLSLFDKLTINLIDLNKNKIQINSFLENHGEAHFIKIQIKNDTKPGKYYLNIEKDGKILLGSDIYFNYIFNQETYIYKTGSKIPLNFILFDYLGNIKCTDNLNVKVKNLTTNSQINIDTKNFNCLLHNNEYKLSFEPEKNGTYLILIDSTNDKSEEFPIGDFLVLDNTNIINIVNQAPSLISFKEVDSLRLDIYPDEDFIGTLIDYVPADLTISSVNNQKFENYKKIEQIINLRYPFDGNYSISLGFGDQPDSKELKTAYSNFEVKAHDGIDYALPEGTPVKAADNGLIIDFPQKLSSYGTNIVIQHGWGGRTFYGHLSEVKIQIGQWVDKGDVIGYSGHTGLADGPHLHFGMDLNNSDVNNGFLGKINPEPYLKNNNEFNQSLNKISWDVSLKKGEKKSYGFNFKLSADSSKFSIYDLGIVQLFDLNNNLVFTQNNKWKLIKNK
ncbi:MAG: M23 family metallopeptidase [bacterium]